MASAQTKYEELVEENRFKTGPKKEDAIVSLTVQLKDMESKFENIAKNGTTPKKEGDSGNPKKDKKCDRERFPVEPWMLVPPKNGESNMKTIVGDPKPWYWCTGHDYHEPRWVCHKLEKCKGLLKKQEMEAKKGTPGKPKSE